MIIFAENIYKSLLFRNIEFYNAKILQGILHDYSKM